MGYMGNEVTQTDLEHSSQLQSDLSDVLHGGLTHALMMTVPWLVTKVTDPGAASCTPQTNDKLSAAAQSFFSECQCFHLEIDKDNRRFCTSSKSVLSRCRGNSLMLQRGENTADFSICTLFLHGFTRKCSASFCPFKLCRDFVCRENPLLFTVQIPRAFKFSFPLLEMWLSCNQAVHLTLLEILVLCSHTDCSAKEKHSPS